MKLLSAGLTTRRRRSSWLIWMMLCPALGIFLAYRIIPLLWNAVLSLQFWSMYEPPTFAGLYHYKEMLFLDDTFRQSLENTLIYMASAPIAIALALGVAILLDQPIRGRGLYRTAFFVSYPALTVAVAIIWLWLYDDTVGLFNYVLLTSGLVERPLGFLKDNQLALAAVIVASSWQVIGLYMIILLTGLQSIPKSLYDAAATDGAGVIRRFVHITLPLIRPSLFLCVVVGIINSFAAFDLVYVMTGGGPGHATELLVTYIYNVAFSLGRFDYAAALTVANFLLFTLIAWFANRMAGGDAGATATH